MLRNCDAEQLYLSFCGNLTSFQADYSVYEPSLYFSEACGEAASVFKASLHCILNVTIRACLGPYLSIASSFLAERFSIYVTEKGFMICMYHKRVISINFINLPKFKMCNIYYSAFEIIHL